MVLSKKEGVCLGFLFLASVVLYNILIQVYYHLIVLTLLYVGYRVILTKVEKTIDIAGKGVLVTGCDTGFGHDLALRLESLGCTVYAGCYEPESEGAKSLNKKNSGRMHILRLDVTSDASVQDTLQYVKKHSTGLWALVNNAGTKRLGDIELILLEHMKLVAEVNLYGMVRVTKAFIPMIRQSKGRIINVSSVKGQFSVPQDSAYTCSKYAVEAFSDALRREMYKFDVTVCIVEPANFGAATMINGKVSCDKMENDLKDAWKSVPPNIQELYGWQYVNALIQGARLFGTRGAKTTTTCVDAMVDALTNTCPKSRYLVPGGARGFDKWILFPTLNGYLPDSAMDLLLTYVTPQPKLALGLDSKT